MEFHRELLGEWIVDDTYEFFVRAWMAYHKAADKFDGHIISPKNKQEYELVRMAIGAGTNAMNQVFRDHGHTLDIFWKQDKRWKSANLEALRRLERGI